MDSLRFFEKKLPFNKVEFQSRLDCARELIKQNESIIAMKVFEVLDSNKLCIRPFFELSKTHYFSLKKDSEKETSNQFPPSDSSIQTIESTLYGIIFDDEVENVIYINSRLNPRKMASVLIHEVSHYLNNELYQLEIQTKSYKLAHYNDEVRAFIAEKMFEKNGQCLMRNDVKKIHKKVENLYQEYIDPEEKTPKGYIYSDYDNYLFRQFC